MRRFALAAFLVLSACGSDDDVEPQFRVGPCDSGSAYTCQAACRTEVIPTGAGCEGAYTVQNGETAYFSCASTFEWEGLEGCCFHGGTVVQFLQCP